jgi:hypothetical protein
MGGRTLRTGYPSSEKAVVERTHRGEDYPGPYDPINAFQEITGTWK